MSDNDGVLSLEELLKLMTEETPFIPIEEAFYLYCDNSSFKKYIDTGMFVYRGRTFMSRIEFRAMDIPDYLQFLHYKYHFINSAEPLKSPEQLPKNSFREDEHNKKVYELVSQWSEKFLAYNTQEIENAQSANEVLLTYMQKNHWNVNTFMEKTLLTAVDYSRLKKPDYIFRKPAYVAMAVGLNLNILQLQKILYLAGYALVERDKTDNAYKFMFFTMACYGIDYCNEFLEKVGLPLLGTKSRDK